MKTNDKAFTAIGLFLTLIFIVFITDIVTNAITSAFSLPIVPESIVDGMLIILLAYPTLYIFIFRPLSNEISQRREGEKELRRLAAIVEFSDDAIIGKTLDGKIVTWNRGAEKIYGYTAAEIKGKPISLLAPGERADEILRLIEKIRSGKSVEHYETIRKRKDGEVIYVSLTISPIRDSSGNIVGASTISRDITEHKMAEQLLRHAKERAELLFRITPSAILTLDKEMRITSWNDKAAEITGYSSNDVLGKTCSIFTDLPCGKDCDSYAHELVKPSMGLECDIKTKDGRTLTILKNTDYMNDPRGNIVGIIESFEDITARKRLEEALRESRDYFNEIINSVADPIFVKDRQHRWVLINNAYSNFIGRKRDEVIGKTQYDLFPEKEARSFAEKDELVFKTGEENLSEEEFTGSDGVIHTIATKKTLYTDNNGAQFIVGVIRDVTERKRVEKLKDEFIGTVSHEIRTPLSITKEGVSLVLDKVPGPINEQQARILTIAKNNIDRLARIINSLLDISKIESGRTGISWEAFEIIAVIKQVTNAFELKIKEKGLILRADLPKVSINIHGDTDSMIQVLTNLIGNALKFTDKGFIDVAAKDKGANIEISVSDTGIGIAEENLPKLFEKFQQFGRVNGPGEKGTGLGLAIAKGIVLMHKGNIWAESEPGKGTKITFTIPKDGRQHG